MIIKCPNCGRRYRASNDLMAKKSARFRCTGCGHIFRLRQKPPVITHKEDSSFLDIPIAPEEDFKKIAGLLDEIDKSTLSGKTPEEGFEAPSKESPVKHHAPQTKREGSPGGKERSFSKGWFTFLVMCLAIVAAALILAWSEPLITTVTKGVTETLVTLESWITSSGGSDVMQEVRQGIELIDVEESVHENWISGKILLIQGTAANKSNYTLSSIRVRGKLMDIDKNVIAETESYCGNLLTEEELRNLTRREIERESMMPAGRDRRGFIIPPGGSIPFMIAFVNPAKEAGVFAVELVDATLADLETGN